MFRFKEKSLILMVGASRSGKSTLCHQLLSNLEIFEGNFRGIFYIATYRPSFADELPNVDFFEEIPEELPPNSLVIFDDLIYNPKGMKLAAKYAFRDCNNASSTAIVMTQRLFVANDNYRMIADNCNYMILFKQLRGEHKLSLLSRDILSPRLQDYFKEAYDHATSQQYGYLVIYIGFGLAKEKSLFTRILGEKGGTIQYENE
jgi:hypothetical protein